MYRIYSTYRIYSVHIVCFPRREACYGCCAALLLHTRVTICSPWAALATHGHQITIKQPCAANKENKMTLPMSQRMEIPWHTSIKYYKAKRRLSPRAWNSKVQKGDCRHTRAWNTTLQKGDCRHEHQILQCKKAIVATHEHGLLQCKKAIVATNEHGILHCKKAIVAAKKHNRGTYNYVAQRRYNEIQTMHDVLRTWIWGARSTAAGVYGRLIANIARSHWRYNT